MFQIDRFDIKLVFDLDNGVYVFESESSSGKTRLAELLKTYGAYGEPVAAYIYAGHLDKAQLEDVLTPGKYKVIMLDRYDLYSACRGDLFDLCAESSIILIDCKQDGGLGSNVRMCTIEMSPDIIEVRL